MGEGRRRFVAYGSLRLGGSRSSVFRGLAVPTDTEISGFRLYDTGHGFPITVPADHDHQMTITVWTAIDDAAAARIQTILDEIEGVSVGLYRRQTIVVDGADALIYLPGVRLAAGAASMRLIESGDWITDQDETDQSGSTADPPGDRPSIGTDA